MGKRNLKKFRSEQQQSSKEDESCRFGTENA